MLGDRSEGVEEISERRMKWVSKNLKEINKDYIVAFEGEHEKRRRTRRGKPDSRGGERQPSHKTKKKRGMGGGRKRLKRTCFHE